MNTPARSVRISDELWNAARAEAERRGETVTDVIARALDAYAPRSASSHPVHWKVVDGQTLWCPRDECDGCRRR